jgi:aminomethyltransferase
MLLSSFRRSAATAAFRSTVIASASRRTMMAAAAAASDAEPLMKTSLNEWHKELGGEMVPFAGYELPVLYKGPDVENGGVMKEHLWCRSEGKASLFDVSHMGQVCFYFLYYVLYLLSLAHAYG